jgi:O-antigen chain-terminating methyltransferase
MIRQLETAGRDRDAAQERMHGEYLEALQRATSEMQGRFWGEMQRVVEEQKHLIHSELRIIRRRGGAVPPTPERVPAGAIEEAEAGDGISRVSREMAGIDYARFEERFRGEEPYVTQSQEFYLPFFEGCQEVADLGCGRGEFLELLRGRGIRGYGVDLDADAVSVCREKDLEVERGDLFEFLQQREEDSLDGILISHVVEHLAPGRFTHLAGLAARKLRAGGVLAIETPNPQCLAIYAGDFYIDPSHVRPVPPELLHFCLEEEGFTGIEVRERHPAAERFPELAAMDQMEELRGFRERFFGGLDYALIAHKPLE